MSCSREADECMIDILTFFSAIFHVVLLAACLCNLSMIPIFITSSIITILPQKRRTATMALRMSICTSTKRPFSRPSRGTRHAFIVSLHARNALARLVRVSRVVRAFRSSVNGRHTQSGQRSGIANERSECCISRQCVLLLLSVYQKPGASPCSTQYVSYAPYAHAIVILGGLRSAVQMRMHSQ